MIAEVISIGDELTSGQRLDTNSQWISQQLGNLGVRVVYQTTVADSMQANIQVFQNAFERADILVCTGGLGPTADDLTRLAIAKSLEVGLYRCEESLTHIRSLFERRNRTMPEQNVVQADFPVGSTPIFNPNGSAPGILYESLEERKLLMAYPGVPAELKEMFAQSGVPKLVDFLGSARKHIVHKPIKCFGIGESELESRLPDLIKRGRDPQVGITASSATITLRISAEGSSQQECESKIVETEKIVRECLGELVYGEDDQELQDVVVDLLRSRKQTLALAEVGTGGYLAHLFSSADEEGDVFVGSTVARNNDRISQLLQEPCAIEETAIKLAEQTRYLFDADYAIAVDAFPDNDADLLRLAVASSAGVSGAERPFGGHPSILLPRAAKQAMNVLRLQLLNA